LILSFTTSQIHSARTVAQAQMVAILPHGLRLSFIYRMEYGMAFAAD
jgi:hypothetical protein